MLEPDSVWSLQLVHLLVPASPFHVLSPSALHNKKVSGRNQDLPKV